MAFFWPVVVLVLFALLLVAWLMDRSVRRRGSRVLPHQDVWHEVRDSRRNAEVVGPFVQDGSWPSWSRRDRR